MNLIKFNDWLATQNESSPATRSRIAAANGTGPSIPDAEINAHSTAPPWMKKKIMDRNKDGDKKKKKSDKKKD